MKIKNINIIKKIRIDVIVISKNIKIKMCFIKSKNNSSLPLLLLQLE